MPDTQSENAEPCGSYAPADVTFLLKSVVLPPISVEAKEALIQSGARHYSEMLSSEAAPGQRYMEIYGELLSRNGGKLAQHINTLADSLAARPYGPRGLALTSLARAGTPIGVLLTRALRRRGMRVEHFSISIIRDRGIDGNALRHILATHDAADIVFVDGWTGKGAIAKELRGPRGSRLFGVEPYLVVVADPAGRADLAASFEDYVIPSGILNGIISGLLSRSILNETIGANDFHGCVRLDHLQSHDVSRAFIEVIDRLTMTVGPQIDGFWSPEARLYRRELCDLLIAQIALGSAIQDINRIKPGIAEATRALLRRVPHRLLLKDVVDPEVRHLVHLAEEKNVLVEGLPSNSNFRAVAIIAGLGGD